MGKSLRQNRLALGLSASGALACIVAGALLSQAPIMRGGRYPALGEIVGMIAVPAIAAIGATWASWQNRPFLVLLGTALVGLYSLVTGFSIGTAFLPAVVLLVWGTFAAFANRPDQQASAP
jgi:hypothetical protein